MVEYAALVAEMALGAVGAFAHSTEMWLGRINWQVIGIAAMALLALRIVARALRRR